MKSPLTIVKNIIKYVPRKTVYTTFIVTLLYTLVIYSFLIFYIVGSAFNEKVWILSPYKTSLSQSTLFVINSLEIVDTVFLLLLVPLSFLMLYKEYKEYQARVVVKNNHLDVIE